jgi:hypothetical protein
VSGFCQCVGKKDAAYLRLFFSAQASPALANPAFSVSCAKPKKLCFCPPSGKCYKVKKVTGANFYSSCVGGSCALYAAPICSSASKKAGFKAKKKFSCADAASAAVSGLPIAASVSCAGCGAAKKMIKASGACTLQYAYFPTTVGNISRNVTGPSPPPLNGTGSPPPLNGTGSPPPPPPNSTTSVPPGGSTLSGGSVSPVGSTVSGASVPPSTASGGSTASGATTETTTETSTTETTTETTTTPAAGR